MNGGERRHAVKVFTDAMKMTDESKKGLIEMATSPKYKEAVGRLARALALWQLSNPNERLEWQDTSNVLIAGGPLDSEKVRGYLAANDAAHRCLVWADEQTGRELTVMQAQFALCVLGWVRP